MWRYFYSKGTYKWIDILDELVYNYNDTKHSTILMKPKDVNKENEDELWTTLFGHSYGESPLPKFRVDDTVRISNINQYSPRVMRLTLQKSCLKWLKSFVVTQMCTR